MKKTMFFLMMILLLAGASVFADDVIIDSSGNMTTGASATDGNLEVTAASGEDGIVGSTSGTGAAGVYGENTTSGNYGFLGDDNFGVYGKSTSGWAGYFLGDARVTGNLTVDGLLLGYTETDPQVGTLTSGMWCTSDGTSVNCTSAAPVTSETDPVFGASTASGISSGQISNWDTAYGWGDHASAGYDTTNDSWTGTGNVYTTSGNVGIGTASPGYDLEVRGGVNAYLGYFYNDNDTSGNAYGLFARGDAYHTGTGYGYGGSFYGTGGSTSGNAYGTRNYAYANGSSNAYGVYSDADDGNTTGREYAFFGYGDAYVSGNVGIGTTTPYYSLDVRGGVSTYLGYFYNDNNTSGNALGLYVGGDAYGTGTGNGYGGYFLGQGGSTSGTAYATRHYAYAYGSSNAYGVYSDADGGTTTGSEFAFYGIGDAYVSGNVGIGTAAPSHSLDVRGGVSNYLGYFLNDNNTSGSAYGLFASADAYGTGTGNAYAGYFYGIGGSTNGAAYGVYIDAHAYGSSTAYGVYSAATHGSTTGSEYAFYGIGDAYVSGTLSKGAGSFKIDHPLDPENKYLYHSFVESPDMMNVYNGNIVLDSNGEAMVTMPDWFEALNKDFRYQLTAIGAPGPNLYIAQEISGNAFAIAGGQPGMKVSWQVTGVRQDAFANANRIPVEEDKVGIEVGTYLHPEAHGQPAKRSLAEAQAVKMGHKPQ